MFAKPFMTVEQAVCGIRCIKQTDLYCRLRSNKKIYSALSVRQAGTWQRKSASNTFWWRLSSKALHRDLRRGAGTEGPIETEGSHCVTDLEYFVLEAYTSIKMAPGDA